MRTMTCAMIVGLAIAGGMPPVVAHRRSQPVADGGPGALRPLAACRAITVDADRLACYDKAAGTLLVAEEHADIVVVDRAEVQQTRKSMFGLALPDMQIFRRHGQAIEEVQQIDGVIASASTNSSGQWLFRLQDGANWQQIDTYTLGHSPRAGDPVVVKRAALGSFKLSVAGHNAVRVHRIN